MYGLKLENVDNTNPYEELIKLFLQPQQYQLLTGDETGGDQAAVFTFAGDKDQLKRELYQYLQAETGRRPQWGILTGIRPVKLAGELERKWGGAAAAKQILMNDYLVDERKVDLLLELYAYQQQTLGKAGAKHSRSLYWDPILPHQVPLLFLYIQSGGAGGNRPLLERPLQRNFLCRQGYGR